MHELDEGYGQGHAGRGDGVDPARVVAPVIQNLTARRLARSVWGLALIVVVAGADLVAGVSPRVAVAIALAGALLAFGSMVARGMAGVRNAFGDAPALWMSLAGLSFAAAHLFALWIFGIQGLRALAVSARDPVAVLVGFGYLGAGLRLMVDLSRVSAVGNLARFMSVPAPEERGG